MTTETPRSDSITKTLDYDRSRAPTPMVWLHRIAFACGVVPMVIGIAIFVAFLFRRTDGLAMLGFLTILAGCAAAFVGGVCLGVYWFQAARATPADAAVARRNAKRDAVVILANFPLAFVFAAVGLGMLSAAQERVRVTVTNADAVAADRVTLDTGRDAVDLGPIAPGASATATVRYGGSGLTATLHRGSAATRHTIFDHMDADTIGPSGTLRLVIRSGRITSPR